MRQHGRKSTAQLSVISLPGARIPPPSGLTKAQAEVWLAVVATKPASWFTADSTAILSQYCRHVTTADALAKMIDAIDPASPDQIANFDRLLTLRDRESKIILRLATSMRCTQLSRIKAETAGTQAANAGGADKPWQVA